jgi:hypothetical protein
VKYNPDKRDFVLTESALSSFNQQQRSATKGAVDFDRASDISKTESQISYGNRFSQFGFTDMFGLSKGKTFESKQEEARRQLEMLRMQNQETSKKRQEQMESQESMLNKY